MNSSTSNLVLAADAAIDLHLHTTFSDGTWTPAQLLDHLAQAQFGLVAITDHDRPDTAEALQQLAQEKDQPLLIADVAHVPDGIANEVGHSRQQMDQVVISRDQGAV